MKRILISGLVALVIALAAHSLRAQGTMTYLSSLSQTSTGSPLLGSNLWLAAPFGTGTNAGGYKLDSIQLGMADASGSPSNFTVMIYSAITFGAIYPQSSLGTLSGSLNPTTAGVYTFTPVLNLTLSPNTDYFIVLTAGTTVANGAYSWDMSTFPPSSSGNWGELNVLLQSGDGISGWSPTPDVDIGQFAINATAIPEPGVLSLFALGGLAFLWHRRKTKAVFSRSISPSHL